LKQSFSVGRKFKVIVST